MVYKKVKDIDGDGVDISFEGQNKLNYQWPQTESKTGLSKTNVLVFRLSLQSQ